MAAAAVREVENCASTPEGAGFNDKLNRAAYTAGGLVAGGYLDEAEIRRALLEAAEHARPGSGPRALATIVAGMNAGRTRPLHPEGRR